jgi:septum formation protein
MIKSDIPIYLASKSPRRRKLLNQINLNFQSFSVDLSEEIMDGEHPVQTVKRLALDKMELAKKDVEEGVIITADTIVVCEGKVLGKPADEDDAVNILKYLSNKTHYVYTGFVIYNSKTRQERTAYEKTAVTFHKLSKREIEDYVKGGSPMDKAGAYGIQDDFGAVFVKRIEGCYYNVVGLPLSKVYKILSEVVNC